MKRGVPPTERNARTGELTPPGVVCCARANKDSLDLPVALEWGAVMSECEGKNKRKQVTAD
jgi:hypothetical protein